jgi:hypothetical protein
MCIDPYRFSIFDPFVSVFTGKKENGAETGEVYSARFLWNLVFIRIEPVFIPYLINMGHT